MGRGIWANPSKWLRRSERLATETAIGAEELLIQLAQLLFRPVEFSHHLAEREVEPCLRGGLCGLVEWLQHVWRPLEVRAVEEPFGALAEYVVVLGEYLRPEGDRKWAVAIRGTQWQSAAIGGNQKGSEVGRGNQRIQRQGAQAQGPPSGTTVQNKVHGCLGRAPVTTCPPAA